MAFESFTQESVADGRWMPLGDACLTAATSSSTPGGSTLADCAKTSGTSDYTGQPNGYLQLTDDTTGSTADVLFNRAIPSRAGLDVEFTQYQFSGTAGAADGIGFFLTDGAYTLDTPGPTGSDVGGALGYGSIQGRSGDVPGIDQGVLGVGLDSFGNYVRQPYVGVNCDEVTPANPGSVALRGGGNGLDGYCLLDQQKLDPSGPQIQTAPAPVGSADDALGTRVRIVIAPSTDENPYPLATLFLNGVEIASHQFETALPDTVKLGFAASTGAQTDAHFVRNVQVNSVVPMGAIDIEKVLSHENQTGDQAPIFTAGDDADYKFTVTNTGADTLTNIVVTDPNITNITCPSATLAAADSMDCYGTWVGLPEDQAGSGEFINTAGVTGETPDGPVEDSSEAIIPAYTTGNFSATKIVTGDAAHAVEPGREFYLDYSYPVGDYAFCAADGTPTPSPVEDAQYPAGSGRLTIVDGQVTDAPTIPTGAVVSLSEVTPTPIDNTDLGIELSSESVTIGCQSSTVAMSVTNTYTGINGNIRWQKTDDGATLLPGSQWSLTGPDGQVITVIDNADNDADPADGALWVVELGWGSYELTETQAPEGYELNDTVCTATVGFAEITADLGNIVNLAIPGPDPTPEPTPDPGVDPGTDGGTGGGTSNAGSVWGSSVESGGSTPDSIFRLGAALALLGAGTAAGVAAHRRRKGN